MRVKVFIIAGVVSALVLGLGLGYYFGYDQGWERSQSNQSATKDSQLYQKYENYILGFTMSFAPGWVLPKSNDNDPHFYYGQECIKNLDGLNAPCPAMEVQGSDYRNPEEVIQEYKDLDNFYVYEYGNLVPGAIVVKSSAPGPAEGWDYQYHIFFTEQKKSFLIFTNDENLEYGIVAGLRLR